MNITWHECKTYAEARNYWDIIYLPEWAGKPFYWGKAQKSFFGGHKRNFDGLHATGRYSNSYAHWIEGCLQHGARLYVGKPAPEDLPRLGAIEEFLIHTYPSTMNKRLPRAAESLQIQHGGSVPASISNANERA